MLTVLKPSAPDAVSESRPMTEPPKNAVVTQTRKLVNSTVALDYREVCKQLDAATQKVRALIQAKNDLELMAQLSNITLHPSTHE